MLPAYEVSRWYFLFFGGYLILGLFLIMNLLLAIIYSNFKSRFEKQIEDKDEKNAHVKSSLNIDELICDLDENNMPHEVHHATKQIPWHNSKTTPDEDYRLRHLEPPRTSWNRSSSWDEKECHTGATQGQHCESKIEHQHCRLTDNCCFGSPKHRQCKNPKQEVELDMSTLANNACFVEVQLGVYKHW